ncbi:60S ribosomal protein L34 [Diplonema papillatum]|nr:60S ribosomal protein L34 [Diplonema papillatum]
MVQRLFLCKHSSFPTKSNKFVMKHVPGGKLRMAPQKKKVVGPCTPRYLGHKRVAGVKALRPVDAANAPKRRKTVSRAYGGVLTHGQVKDRVIRAFLIEEQKIVKRVLSKRR